MIELLEELRQDHPAIVDRMDPEAKELAQPTDPKQVADAIIKRRQDEESSPTP